MQAISLMSLVAGQAGSAPAQGGSQTATTANAGLFQGMLLEALLGGQISPELAAQIQPAPQSQAQPAGAAATGQVKAPESGVLLSGPAAAGIAPAQVPDVLGPTTDSEPTGLGKAPLVAQAPNRGQAPPKLQSDSNSKAQVKPEAPVNPLVAVAETLPVVAEQAEPETQSAAPKALDAPEAQQPATPDSAVVQALMQVQAVPQQLQVAAQPAAPAPQTGAPAAAVVAEAAADPQLEAFVQRAVKLAQGEQPEAPVAEAKTPAGPTFQDLVKLVVEAGQASGTKHEATANPEARDQAPTPAPVPTPTRPVLQATPEQHDPAPAPVKAPKAAEGPEKAPEITLAQAPRPTAHEAATAAPDAPQAAPRQPVDPEQVLRQVSRFVKVMVDSKQSEVRLQLHPENLGSVGVRLVLGDGALKANLVAQDAAVKAALEANLDQLKTRLTDQGFQVEQVHVTVGGGDGGFNQPQHSRQGEQRQPQQPWRSQSSWQTRKEEESSPLPYNQRTAPTWFLKGTGARINSLA